MFRPVVLGLALVTSMVFASPVSAATLIVNSDGKLVGATGVDVRGTLYDVRFVEGSCVNLFSGCNSPSNFDFVTKAGADEAASAIVSQVFLNNALGLFNSNYRLMLGCAENTLFKSGGCVAVIPYTAKSNITWASIALNFDTRADEVGSFNSSGTFDTTAAPYAVFARFGRAVSSVPEPATWALTILGFFAIGAGLRGSRQRRPWYLGRVGQVGGYGKGPS